MLSSPEATRVISSRSPELIRHGPDVNGALDSVGQLDIAVGSVAEVPEDAADVEVILSSGEGLKSHAIVVKRVVDMLSVVSGLFLSSRERIKFFVACAAAAFQNTFCTYAGKVHKRGAKAWRRARCSPGAWSSKMLALNPLTKPAARGRTG